MIAPEKFYHELHNRGIRLFAGVPDSLLKHFCAFLDAACAAEHIITANEGNAVALAAGHHLATGGLGAVYMQNSGLGNCVNPLTSLTAPQVYSIPMLLIIGWRGEPGTEDEPQHVQQGQITQDLLELLGIPHFVLDKGSNLEIAVETIFADIRRINGPAAFLVRKGTFTPWISARRQDPLVTDFKREQALKCLLELADPDDLIISTTGKTSRELFELRVGRGEAQRDFLTVGSMGHASSIALGVARSAKQRRVVCLDGDGALLMHLGALPVIGAQKPGNLVHVLLNNAAHESVGGQSTVAGGMELGGLARSCGYKAYHYAATIDDLRKCWRDVARTSGPHLLEIRIAVGTRKDLGRPTTTPEQNKRAFMEAARG